jgi:hypothetical protein
LVQIFSPAPCSQTLSEKRIIVDVFIRAHVLMHIDTQGYPARIRRLYLYKILCCIDLRRWY